MMFGGGKASVGLEQSMLWSVVCVKNKHFNVAACGHEGRMQRGSRTCKEAACKEAYKIVCGARMQRGSRTPSSMIGPLLGRLGHHQTGQICHDCEPNHHFTIILLCTRWCICDIKMFVLTQTTNQSMLCSGPTLAAPPPNIMGGHVPTKS